MCDVDPVFDMLLPTEVALILIAKDLGGTLPLVVILVIFRRSAKLSDRFL